MRICIFSRGHISKLRGGVDRVTDTISNELEKRGHLVYMISACNPVENDVLQRNQYVLPDHKILSRKNKDFVIGIYKELSIDIILNQSDLKSIFDLIIETHNKIPTVSYYHGDPKAITKDIHDNWDEWKLRKGKLFLFYSPYYLLRCLYQYHNRKKYISSKYREYYEKNDAIILLSEKFKESFIGLTRIKNPRKLHFIGNPNTYSQSSNALAEKKDIVIFVGRLDFQKRVDRLLKVWKIINKNNNGWKLQIIGDGSYKGFYEQLARKLSLRNVEFIGACDPTEFYKRSKIICMTSSHEGFGMVITEAMQHCVIPIAYNSYESITDIIDDGINGFLIKPFCTKRFANKIIRLIEDKKLMEQIQQNIINDDIKEKFSVSNITNKIENLFNCLIS